MEIEDGDQNIEHKNEYLKYGIEKRSREPGGKAKSGGEKKGKLGFGIK